MELGKDIITINPDGTPCAFQLKTSDISLAKWRNELSSQTLDLVNLTNKPPISRQFKASQIVSVVESQTEKSTKRSVVR